VTWKSDLGWGCPNTTLSNPLEHYLFYFRKRMYFIFSFHTLLGFSSNFFLGDAMAISPDDESRIKGDDIDYKMVDDKRLSFMVCARSRRVSWR
jgi:hypothetical protein